MGLREDFQETLRLIYQQTANQLEKFWKDKTGNLFSGNKINASALPVDGTTITITAGPGGPVITAGGGGVGTVTSVALSAPSSILSVGGSPVTHSGTLALSLATQVSNTVWAGPTTGIAATPTFRGLVPADIPSLDAAKIGTGTFTSARLPAMVASGASHAPGVVPDPPSSAGSVKFLREDASWAIPPGSGDATFSATGVLLADKTASVHPVALTAAAAGLAGGAPLLAPDGAVPSFLLPQAAGALSEVGRWVRDGTHSPLISAGVAWEAGWVDEPSPLYKDGVYHLWYGGGISNRAIGHATATAPTGPYTKDAGNPVLGQGGSSVAGTAQQNHVILIDGTFWCYYSDGTNIRVATSPDGSAWTRNATTCITAGGSPASQWANPAVWREQIGVWHMILEGLVGGVWAMYHLTSADGVGFTLDGFGALTTLSYGGAYGGPCLPSPQRIDGVYHLWYHAATSGNLPTDLYRATSTDLQHWTKVAGPLLTHTGSGFEVDQCADPYVQEWHGQSYLFYAGVDNVGGAAHVLLATFGGTLAQIARQAPVSTPLTDPTASEGDMLYRHSGALARLGVGTAGQLLGSDGTDPAWQAAPSGLSLTTKGDLQGFSTVPARVPVSGVDGRVLTEDSAQAAGVRWATPATLSRLDQMADVYLNNLQDGDTLSFAAVLGQWINSSAGFGADVIEDGTGFAVLEDGTGFTVISDPLPTGVIADGSGYVVVADGSAAVVVSG